MYKKTMREALKEARAYRDPIDEGITGNIQKAITIAKKMGGNMTGAIKEIEKIAKGLSDDPSVRAALKTANESLDEAKDLMLTYGKPGGDAKVYYTDFMQDLQNKASEFRKKGFVIGKMGKTMPMSQLPKKMLGIGMDIKEEELEEKMKLKYDKDKEGFYDEKGRRRYLSIGATNAIMRKKLDHAMKTGDWTDFNKEELEEEFKVKFIDPANKKKFHITYRSNGEAEAKMAQLKNDGVTEIEIVQEETGEENEETV
jgi:hypothetical protein